MRNKPVIMNNIFRVILGLVLASSVLLIESKPAAALNALEYFSLSYSMGLNKTEVEAAETFQLSATVSAVCTKDLPLTFSEVNIRGRIIARNSQGGVDLTLGQYTVTVKPFPSKQGQSAQNSQAFDLQFPEGTEPGTYYIIGELVNAKAKFLGIPIDVTNYLPSSEWSKQVGTITVIPPADSQEPGDTTQEPGDTTQEPGDTTQEPGDTTQQPGDTAQQPGDTAQEPVDTSQQSENTTQESGNTTQQSIDIPQQPTAGTQEPGDSTVESGNSTSDNGTSSLSAPDRTDISSHVGTDGTFLDNLEVKSVDGICRLNVDIGTKGLNQEKGSLAEITMLKLKTSPDPPLNSSIIGSTYDLGPDGATFSPSANLTIGYDDSELPEGIDENALIVSMWDDSSGRWTELATRVDTERNTVTAQVNHFTAFAILAYEHPADFEVSGLSMNPSEPGVGEDVTISVLVSNTGDVKGICQVVLKIDNMTEQVKQVSLAGGTRELVSFQFSPDSSREYAIDVNGQSTILVVNEQPDNGHISYWYWILGGIIITGGILLILYFVIHRRN